MPAPPRSCREHCPSPANPGSSQAAQCPPLPPAVPKPFLCRSAGLGGRRCSVKQPEAVLAVLAVLAVPSGAGG